MVLQIDFTGDDPAALKQKIVELKEKLKPLHPQFISTVAGHVGDGNFHVIPLTDIKRDDVRKAIPEFAKKVYALVLNYQFCLI